MTEEELRHLYTHYRWIPGSPVTRLIESYRKLAAAYDAALAALEPFAEAYGDMSSETADTSSVLIRATDSDVTELTVAEFRAATDIVKPDWHNSDDDRCRANGE